VRLELVCLLVESHEIGHAVVRHPRRELVAHGQRHQCRVSARAAARDLDASGIDVPALTEVERGGSAVFDVDLPPTSAKPVAIFTAVAGAAAVVEVDDGDAAAREELDMKVE